MENDQSSCPRTCVFGPFIACLTLLGATNPCTHAAQEVEGTNIFDLVESGSHNRLRRLLEENLGSVSKEAIASALRHQGTTFESLLARAEKAKEQGDSGFFTMSGEAPRFPGPTRTGSGGGSGGSGVGDMGGSTDDWESEAASLAGESQGRTTGASSSSGGGVAGGGSSSGGGGGRKIKRWNTVGSSGSGGMSDSSSGGGGAGGGGGVGKGKDAGNYRRSFPPVGPPAFPVVASGERVTGGGSAAAGGGGAQSGGGANGAAGGTRHAKGGGSLLPEGAKAREVGGAARKLELCSDAQGESAGGGPISGGSDGGGSGGGKASMVNVDRDLQSKINAFTNTQKVSETFVWPWFSTVLWGGGRLAPEGAVGDRVNDGVMVTHFRYGNAPATRFVKSARAVFGLRFPFQPSRAETDRLPGC